MSDKRGWFSVRSERTRAIEGLRAASLRAPGDAVPSAFGVVENQTWTTFEILGWEIGHAYRWAQAISIELQTVAIAFFTLEDTWSYSVFDCGEHLGGQESYAEPLPCIYGDPGRIARVIGVDEALLYAYCVGHPFGDHDEDELEIEELDEIDQAMESIAGYRVRASDHAPPWDDVVAEDFARHLGLPGPGAPEEVGVESNPARSEWAGLTALLDPAAHGVHRFDPRRFREEVLGIGGR